MLDSNILLNIYVHYNDNSNSTVTLIFENKFIFAIILKCLHSTVVVRQSCKLKVSGSIPDEGRETFFNLKIKFKFFILPGLNEFFNLFIHFPCNCYIFTT